MSDKGSGSSGIGFLGCLAILFIGLKLGGVINWSWVWVLAPIWIHFIVILVACTAAVIVVASRGK